MTSQVSCQAGVKRVPCRGPRTVLIRRESGGFGFTLRHFIVYPPDSVKKKSFEEPSISPYSGDPEWQNSSSPSESMDTIFVREVREGSCAQLAGLVTGDRIITINKQPLTGKSYSQVIDLIQNSGNTLHLLVVPKEDDILQKYFSGSAYQPVERSISQVESQSLSVGRQRSSLASSSCVGTEPVYAHVRKRALSHQETKLDNSWPQSHRCSAIASYPSNCHSLNCLTNQASTSSSHTHSSSLCNTRESQPSYRSSIALNSNRSRSVYSSQSHDDDCPEPLYATPRPYRFQDTFSKLLVDMWYPQNKGVQHPSSHLSKQENIYRMREHGKPGLAAGLFKTVKSFLPAHENTRSQEQWSEPSNGFYGKPSKAEYLDTCRETDILDSDSATESSDVPGSLRLVAQRKQQFESARLQDRAQERTNFYRHEFSRVSSPNPCPIVQKRAAQFETMASPTHTDNKSHISRTREEKFDNGFHLATDAASTYRTDSAHRPPSAYHFKPVHVPDGTPNSAAAGVTYRRKHFTDQEKHITRRISYLKATAGERMLVESELNEDEDKRGNAQRPPSESEGSEPRIEKLKALFGEKNERCHDSLDLFHQSEGHPAAGESEDEDDDDVLVDLTTGGHSSERDGRVTQTRTPPPMMEGWLSCKLVFVQGKRSTDRSWRTVWALFRGCTLHLLRDKKEPSNSSPMENSSEIYDTCVNLKTTFASIASDYTKRKHVLRLRLANGTEYLFQADSQINMVDWLYTFKAVGLENEKEYLWHHASVLEKAAAYEQQIGLHQTHLSSGAASPAGREGIPLVSPGHGIKTGSGVKLPFRHRSPTGSSPAVKTRRASHGDELSQGPRLSSVLRSRVGGGWRKTHSLQTEALPKGASVGVRLEDCPPSLWNKYVPLLVDLCVQVVERYGIELEGIFRVPGNNATVSQLIDAVNQGGLLPALAASSPSDSISFLEDPRWKEVNVVSSLLKAFFRKLPEPLLTSALYSKFISASKIEDINKRLVLLRALIHQLPPHHYETLKFLMQHLKNVVDHSHINKMEARNLAIVLGPTLVRPADTSMVALVTDMSHQCYIIETFINYADWLFSDHFLEELPSELVSASRRMSHPLPVSRSDLLLQNLHKLDQSPYSSPGNTSAMPPVTVKPAQELVSRELLSSLMFASNRKHSNRGKVQPPPLSSAASVPPLAGSSSSSSPAGSSCDPSSPAKRRSSLAGDSGPRTRTSSPSPLATSTPLRGTNPTQDTGSLGDEVVHHTYDEINSLTQERIRRFERETRALLRREQPPAVSGRGAPSSLPSTTTNTTTSNKKAGESQECQRIDWQQIEQEWQKAKRELEQDDLLDVVADDPSFLNYLLNRQDHSPPATSKAEYSSAPASLDLQTAQGQVEHLSTSLEGSLQLNSKGVKKQASSSPTTSAKSHQNSLQSTYTHNSSLEMQPWSLQHQDQRNNVWKNHGPLSSSSALHINSLDAKQQSLGTSSESNPTVLTENCQGRESPPANTNYTWHYTPFSKISQS